MKTMQTMRMAMAVVGMSAMLAGGAVKAEDTTSADKTFLADSAQDSMAEIALAKLALSKTGDPNVKEFASKMVKDHTKLIADSKPLSMKLGVKPPTGPSLMQKAKAKELELKSGISFDRAYVEAMVKDHNEDLKKFYEEWKKTENPEMKALVEKGSKVIKEHTEMIDSLAQKGGIEVPPMPSM